MKIKPMAQKSLSWLVKMLWARFTLPYLGDEAHTFDKKVNLLCTEIV